MVELVASLDRRFRPLTAVVESLVDTETGEIIE
jgi:hypothetical protein